MLSNIRLTKLWPWIEEIIGVHQYVFWHNRVTGEIFEFFMPGKGTELQWDSTLSYSNCKKAYNSFERGVLYSIVIEPGVLKFKCLNEVYSKVILGNILQIHFQSKMD